MSHDDQPSTLPQADDTTNDYIGNSDLSMSDDEWVLSLIASLPKRDTSHPQSDQDKKEKKEEVKPPAPLYLDDDDIVIPAVFTTQGATNSRLLKQSEEIDRQLTDEDARMKAQAEELAKLRANILDELNDNGALFRYSMKNDAELVEKYVLKVYAKDHTLVTHRHFFYFDDISEVDDTTGDETLDILFSDMAKQWDVSNHGRMQQTLEENNIAMQDIANHICRKVYDENLLELVEAFVVHVSTQQPTKVLSKSTARSKSTAVSKSTETEGIELYISLLGARLELHHLLRLVHYNNDARVLILKLCIAFHVSLMAPNENDLPALVSHLLLSVSDFILNKREKSFLLERFVRPVFQRLISVCNDNDKFRQLIIDLLGRLHVNIYNEEEASLLKEHEIHYNIVNNLWMAFCQDTGKGRQLAELLMLHYLQFGESGGVEFSVVDLARVITKIGNTKVSPPKPSTIYKNIYRAHITTALLTDLVYSQKEKNKQDYFSLRQCLLDCKDHIQESIGRLLYMSMDEIPDKVLFSMAVSETYHVIDHFTSVLDKNIIFLKRDFFYSK